MDEYVIDLEQLDFAIDYFLKSDSVLSIKNYLIAFIIIVCAFFLYVVIRDMFKR